VGHGVFGFFKAVWAEIIVYKPGVVKGHAGARIRKCGKDHPILTAEIAARLNYFCCFFDIFMLKMNLLTSVPEGILPGSVDKLLFC